jgi:DNA polymerase III subunit beta
MKIRVERDTLADAVAWAARILPQKTQLPVLAGLRLDAAGNGGLRLSGFDYEVSAEAELDVTVAEAGAALVPGRLLADITRSLPDQPVDLATDGSRAQLTCGSARFTLPTLPLDEYPSLPTMPEVAGTIGSDAFAAAVGSVAVAAGRDDTLPVLTGVRIEIDGEEVTLAATDRYRLAVRTLRWKPVDPSLQATALVPARTLAEAAKSLTSGAEVTLALAATGAGEGLLGLAGGTRRTTPGCSTVSSRSTARCCLTRPPRRPPSPRPRSPRRSAGCRSSPREPHPSGSRSPTREWCSRPADWTRRKPRRGCPPPLTVRR